jgi:hypothetical protein
MKTGLAPATPENPTMKKNTDLRSDIAWSTPDAIGVHGYDLCHDLMGEVNFGDMAFLEVTGRLPDAKESRMFNAILVTLGRARHRAVHPGRAPDLRGRARGHAGGCRCRTAGPGQRLCRLHGGLGAHVGGGLARGPGRAGCASRPFAGRPG